MTIDQSNHTQPWQSTLGQNFVSHASFAKPYKKYCHHSKNFGSWSCSSDFDDLTINQSNHTQPWQLALGQKFVSYASFAKPYKKYCHHSKNVDLWTHFSDFYDENANMSKNSVCFEQYVQAQVPMQPKVRTTLHINDNVICNTSFKFGISLSTKSSLYS